VERISTRRFGAPDGISAIWLFGGALFLAVRAVATVAASVPELVGATVALTAVALGVVVAAGMALLRRLRDTAATLERTSREAVETAARLRVLIEHVPAAVYIDMADPDVSDGGRLAYMSAHVRGILGFEPEDFIGDPELWPSRIHPDDRGAAIEAYEAHWRTGEPLRAEYRMIARDGTEIWVRDEAFAMADDTRSGRRVSQGLLVEITDRKRLESKLIHDALHDPLTGLANRVLLRDHLERVLARHGRAPGTVALLFVDLDDFKQINDSFGHAAGDEILCQVAERLGAAVRADDVVGRQSGDEFAILLDRVLGADEATIAAERILRELRRPIQLGGRVVIVGGSIGVAIASERGSTAEDLLIQADAAMYAAKRAGKSTYALFEPQMPVRTWTELEAAG
jgi:diguanylate cyclase (GGDEF)-like protein/PAS domain S-box-containing protein